MKNEKKQLRELSEEDLKNVTGGGYLSYVEPTIDDCENVPPMGTNPDGTCKPGFVLNENGKCVVYVPSS